LQEDFIEQRTATQRGQKASWSQISTFAWKPYKKKRRPWLKNVSLQAKVRTYELLKAKQE
jgi:hypothetical protein